MRGGGTNVLHTKVCCGLFRTRFRSCNRRQCSGSLCTRSGSNVANNCKAEVGVGDGGDGLVAGDP